MLDEPNPGGRRKNTDNLTSPDFASPRCLAQGDGDIANPVMLLLRDVKKSFVEPDGSPLPILDIEEFQVAPGEQMVLVGKSGCGKTTLLHVIAGITRPDAARCGSTTGTSP